MLVEGRLVVRDRGLEEGPLDRRAIAVTRVRIRVRIRELGSLGLWCVGGTLPGGLRRSRRRGGLASGGGRCLDSGRALGSLGVLGDRRLVRNGLGTEHDWIFGPSGDRRLELFDLGHLLPDQHRWKSLVLRVVGDGVVDLDDLEFP